MMRRTLATLLMIIGVVGCGAVSTAFNQHEPLPDAYVGPLPAGAIQVLGLGETTISVSPDARYFAITDWYGARLYDGYTLEPIWEASRPLRWGYEFPRPNLYITWMADGEHIALGSRLYTIEGGQLVYQATPMSDKFGWSPDGKLIVNDVDSIIYLQDAYTGDVVYTIAPPIAEELRLMSADIRANCVDYDWAYRGAKPPQV